MSNHRLRPLVVSITLRLQRIEDLAHLVLLLGRPLVLVFDHILHVLCGLAGWLSDLGGDVAHGGPEDCFQASAYGVANGVEEAC